MYNAEEVSKEITTEAFLKLLGREVFCEMGEEVSTVYLRGKTEGWFTEQDERNADQPLERRAAARLLHGVLKYVLLETDEENWQAAMQLKDLFDCGSCVMHVAQMYVKGILESFVNSSGDELFHMTEALTEAEAEQAIKRLKKAELRLKKELQKPNQYARKVSKTEAMELILQVPGATVVWVGKEEADSKLFKVSYISMMQILENPFILEEYRNRLLLIACEAGYQSEIAANCLAEHGYTGVVYFGMKE